MCPARGGQPRPLAHVTGNEVERAYARVDLFEKRRELMAAWATYCGGSV
jgi:hypothetical protein